MIEYRQLAADGTPTFGPLHTALTRDPSQPASIELTLSYLNPAAAGWFKVASFNTYGTSKESAGQTFLIGGEG